jgi:hypothetical protein
LITALGAALALTLGFAALAVAAPSSITRGAVHGTLRGMNHHPTVGRKMDLLGDSDRLARASALRDGND